MMVEASVTKPRPTAELEEAQAKHQSRPVDERVAAAAAPPLLGISMPRERKYVSAGVPRAGAAMRQSHRALPSCCSGPPTTGGGEGGLGAGRGRAGR